MVNIRVDMEQNSVNEVTGMYDVVWATREDESYGVPYHIHRISTTSSATDFVLYTINEDEN